MHITHIHILQQAPPADDVEALLQEGHAQAEEDEAAFQQQQQQEPAEVQQQQARMSEQQVQEIRQRKELRLAQVREMPLREYGQLRG